MQLGATAKGGCEGFVLDVVAIVRGEYNLPRQTISEEVNKLFSGIKPTF